MASDETGTLTSLALEQGIRSSIDLARALTVLQVGIEILTRILPGGGTHVDAPSLHETLTAATERATDAVTALVAITDFTASPNARTGP